MLDQSQVKRRLFFLLVGLCLTVSGCAVESDSSTWGDVGTGIRSNPNGLAVHKRMWEISGSHCLVVKRLSQKLQNVQVIVLVGQDYSLPGLLARQWLEDWLAMGEGRTVIYFGRDFNARQYYLRQTLSGLDDAQRVLLERQLACERAAELRERAVAYSENLFGDWFFLDSGQANKEIRQFEGPWAQNLADLAVYWPVRTRLLPPIPQHQQMIPSWIRNPIASAGSSGKNSPSINPSKQSDVKDYGIMRSVWSAAELETQSQWDERFEQLLESQILLASDQRDPLVYRLTSTNRLGDGQILVCVNGAPLLNASLVQPGLGRVGEMLVQAALPAKKVAILPFDQTGIQIVAGNDPDARGIGLEMLTQWPLSAVTMPASVLALVILVSLLPIFGRPRDLPAPTVTDFGLHIEAMGQSLQETGDRENAERAIAEYFNRVRNEQPPNWCQFGQAANAIDKATKSSQSDTSNSS